ncbi:MAG: hypothetical protein Q9193_007200, partial [Seirophora villosa]
SDGNLGAVADGHIDFTDLLEEEQLQATAPGKEAEKSLDYLFEEEGSTLTEPAEGDTTLVDQVADQQQRDDSAKPSGEEVENLGSMTDFLNNEIDFPDVDPADYRFFFP